MTRTQPLILMVDDDEDDLMIAKEAFDETGNPGRFIAFQDVEGFFQYLFSSPIPNLILLDINMPLMDGYRVMEKITREPRFASIPIVIISTSAKKHSEAKKLERVAKYFVKPATYSGWIKLMEDLAAKWGG